MEQSLALQRLDEIVTSLGGDEGSGTHGRGACELLLEHLGAARRNLLGSATVEYTFNLEQSLGSLSCIVSKDQRTRTKQALQSLHVKGQR